MKVLTLTEYVSKENQPHHKEVVRGALQGPTVRIEMEREETRKIGSVAGWSIDEYIVVRPG